MAVKRKRLGELVLRSENPQSLVRFYREIIGLEVFATIGTGTFLKIDEDFEGHPQLLAIFDQSHRFSGPEELNTESANAKTGTLHHFAFALDLEDFLSEAERLRSRGVEISTTEHSRFGWRSIYLFDPDGNSVELVCYDPKVLERGSHN